MRKEIKKYLRDKNAFFSVLSIDIDHFKKINDNNGHLFGDQVLLTVANNLRDYDGIRFGGEEFIVLLPKTGYEKAFIVAERIRKSIEGQKIFGKDGKEIQVTISAGIAQFPDHLPETARKDLRHHATGKMPPEFEDRLVEAITGSADKALYKAKDSGRNRCAICCN